MLRWGREHQHWPMACQHIIDELIDGGAYVSTERGMAESRVVHG